MIMKNWRIKVVDQFLPADEMRELISSSDIYVLPAARIHVVSILEAMAYGLAVVVSDGWGFQEYVQDGWNGIVVGGRYGKCSWMDTANGMLREDYSSLWTPDAVVIGGLVDALSALIEDRELCERLGHNARRDVETKFSTDNWNRGLKKAFDKALSKENI
jgi:glycosyltransferase involved in cell wall biosynthesis